VKTGSFRTCYRKIRNFALLYFKCIIILICLTFDNFVKNATQPKMAGTRYMGVNM